MSENLKITLLNIANDISKNERLRDKLVVYNVNKVVNRYWELVELLQQVDDEIMMQKAEESLRQESHK